MSAGSQIPAHNAAATLGDCLGAVRGSDAFESLCREIIVVDDGSTDDTVDVAERHGATVVRLESAHGPGTARNRGAAKAVSEVVLFLDADVLVHPDTLTRAAAHFERADGPDAVIGSYDDTPTSRSVVSLYRNLLHHYVHQSSSEEATTFWGGCGAIRREIFDAVGGFDESYSVPSIEDIELGYRLTDAGFRIRLDKGLQVTHSKRWTLRGVVVTDVTRRAVPWARLLMSRRSLPRDLNLQHRHRVSVGLAFVTPGALLASASLFAAGFQVPGSWAAGAAVIGAAMLLLLNFPLYAFFARKGGGRFALCAVALHCLYYLYSGVALAWVLLTMPVGRRRA